MKIPFVEEIPTFAPRNRLGIRRNMTIEQREILDAIDVIEQKSDAAIRIGVKSYNLGLCLAVAFLILLTLFLKDPAIIKSLITSVTSG